jgi:hypothetical protein
MATPNKQPIKWNRTKSMHTAASSKHASTPKATNATNGNQQHGHAMSEYPSTPAPVSRAKLDKFVGGILIEDLTQDELDNISKQLRQWMRDGILNKGWTKGTNFKESFLRIREGEAVIQFNVGPTSINSHQFMNITFNPDKMTVKNFNWLKTFFEKLFPLRCKQIIRGMRLCRADVCIDIDVDINSLVIRLRKSTVETKFYMLGDNNGRIQTINLGSIQSELHACVYDQVEADKYKVSVGEKPSQPVVTGTRVKAADDAEVIFNRTRFEVRRVFRDLPLVDVLKNWVAPFDRIDVWSVPDAPKIDQDYIFWGYLDSVRLRGVAATRKEWKRRGCKDIERYEALLAKHQVEWWPPKEFGAEVSAIILNSPLWKFLNP